MPRTLTLSTLRTRCKQRADKENDPHISDAEWTSLIDEQYGELYERVAGACLRYFERTNAITATGADSYDEPDDHGKTVGVDRVESDGARHTLLPLMVQDRIKYGGVTGDATEYAIVDDQIYLYPTPSSGSYEMLYIPQAPDLTTFEEADLVDVVCPAGLAFMVWGVAVKALSKSGDSVQLHLLERDRQEKLLIEWACERDANEPRRRVLDPDTGEGTYW